MIEILYDNNYLKYILTNYHAYGRRINKYIFDYFTIRSGENKAIALNTTIVYHYEIFSYTKE